MRGDHTPRLSYSRRPACKTLWSDLASSHEASASRHDRLTGWGWTAAVICVSSIRYMKVSSYLLLCSVYTYTLSEI